MKTKYIQIVGMVFFISLIVSSLFTNNFWKLFEQWGVFNYEFQKQYSQVGLEKADLFRLLLWQKTKSWLLFFILSFSQLHFLGYLIYVGFAGAVCGIGNTILVMTYGMTGIWYFVTMILLPGILWFVAITLSELFAVEKKSVFLMLAAMLFLLASAALETVIDMKMFQSCYFR